VSITPCICPCIRCLLAIVQRSPWILISNVQWALVPNVSRFLILRYLWAHYQSFQHQDVLILKFTDQTYSLRVWFWWSLYLIWCWFLRSNSFARQTESQRGENEASANERPIMMLVLEGHYRRQGWGNCGWVNWSHHCIYFLSNICHFVWRRE